MDGYSQQELQEARRAVASTLGKSEKALQRLRPGSAQHRMTEEAIAAFRIAIELLERAMDPAAAPAPGFTAAELQCAGAAVASARGRVGRVLPKLAPGTPQHTLAVRRIAAFDLALALLRREGREAYMVQVTVGERVPLNGAVRLCDYDPDWPALFEREAERLRLALGRRALQIEHVGSTSVPGLCAKPIVDLLLAVADSADEAAYVPALEAAGYRLRIREPEWFEHRLFRGPGTDINLHVFSFGAAEIRRMLAFRDRLRADEGDRALYADAKRQLARRSWRHVQDYADAKSAAIEDILARALSAADQV